MPDYMVMIATNEKFKLIHDQLGSVRMVVNAATGAVAQRIQYDEFGKVLSDTNPGFQPFGYAGGLYDSDTGLVRFGAREYDPELGRWLSKDPIGFSGGDTNLFSYVGGDPVNLIDPIGLFGFVATVGGQISTFGGSLSSNAFAFFGESEQGLGVGAGIQGSSTVVSVGASAGKGFSGGFCANTIESFLNASTLDINTPIGGISFAFNDQGGFEGVSIGGPSLGFSVSSTPSKNSASNQILNFSTRALEGKQSCP